MKKLLLLLGIIVLVVGCTTTPTGQIVTESATVEVADGKYSLDTAASTLGYNGAKITGSSHPGTVDLKSGFIESRLGVFTAGEFVIDMHTITDADGLKGLEKHLKNEDFFDVEKYPTAKFVLTKATGVGGSYLITGDLTILDVTKEISFPATLSKQGENLRAEAAFSIDRTEWGIVYGSGSFFKDIGDRAIKNEIDFTLDLVFNYFFFL